MGVGVLSLCLLGGVRQLAGVRVWVGTGDAQRVRVGLLMFEVLGSPKSGIYFN